jgi:hypothetical protein
MKDYEIINIIPITKSFVAVFKYVDEDDKSKSFYNICEIYMIELRKDKYGVSKFPMYWNMFKECLESCYENDYFVGCARDEKEAIEIYDLKNINKATNI